MPPTIYATGYATGPTISATIERVVGQDCAGALFSAGALPAEYSMNGKRLFTDSFDSTSPYYSGPGGVYDPNEARENGDLGHILGILNAAEVEIHGRVFWGGITNVWASSYGVTGATVSISTRIPRGPATV
jgi:hypothetical protein